MGRVICRYNQFVVKPAVAFAFLAALSIPLVCAQDTPSSGQAAIGRIDANRPEFGRAALGRIMAGRTMVVTPFENASPTPGLEWLGESFPETFHQQLNSPVLYVTSRDERLRAYDRQGIPAGVHASR